MYASLETGTIHDGLATQKINTQSTTHSEIVAVSDVLPKMLWFRYFMEVHNYTVEDVYMYQDNQSAILLKKNGAQSIGKGSRHVKIKYFLITDKVKSKKLSIIYFPTKQKIADFFNKPL